MKSQKRQEERGVSLIEFGLLVALVAVAAVTSVQVMGRQVSNKMSSSSHSIRGV